MSEGSSKNTAAKTGNGEAPRPEGKRQVAGKATTARASAASKAPEVVATRRNPIAAIVDYFRGVIREMGKVIWPTGKEMVSYTVVVIVFLILMTVLVAGTDYLAAMGIQKLFGL